ncbi:hypothetical protein KP509_01G033500 [Ceratopteris richardii]|uniref:ARM repeat N-terminal plant domain-containing protein n=1 Tax=Ceratopteris richardii TaxID=49495 RepID=A0A8T2VJR5_CERRI|nr:hypothetical protein KP509_01G033500 [Ceratopteris richardii]
MPAPGNRVSQLPLGKSHPSHQQMRNHNPSCCSSPDSCFLCIMMEQHIGKRSLALSRLFKLLQSDARGQAFSVSAIWSSAMARPNDAELVELGVFECMASLIWKGIRDRRWLLRDQNVFIPYYAAHIIGSYTMNRGDFAEKAVAEGVIPPLIELLRGRLTWVEQRVAVRALGHIAAFESCFPHVAVNSEVLEVAMELAVSSLEIVYTQFIQTEEKRLKYHRDLLTRGMRGPQVELHKGEEWASQLQCWSLQLINCFAMKDNYLPPICRSGFLTKLPGMWGGLMNENSPAGVGLILTICRHKIGRSSVAACPRIVHALCNTARSSDDWQYMAVDCLLLMLQDPQTRKRVFDEAVVALVDLAVQPCQGDRKKLGAVILEVLFHQEIQSPMRSRTSSHTRYLLDELAGQCQRWRWERSMPKDDLRVKQQAAHVVKLEGNAKFSAGDVVGAVYKYSEALQLCPLRATRERVVLYSNRAQCHLLLQDPEAAISDTTRALSLHKPLNGHARSLWRRSQAYEMLGLPKESLLDAIMFINECSNAAGGEGVVCTVPDYAERLVKKQMRATWLFLDAARKHGDIEESPAEYSETTKFEYEEDEDSEWETASESDMTLADDGADQGSCSRDEGDNGHFDKELDNPQLASVLSALKDMDLKRKHANEGNPLIELNGKGEHRALDKELLKKRIYNLIEERRLLNLQNSDQRSANKDL